MRTFADAICLLSFLAASLVGTAARATGRQDAPALVEQATVAKQSGRLEEAAALLLRARIAAPRALGPARAACEVALAREENGDPGASSHDPCRAAAMIQTGPEEYRNEVASQMSPAAKPSMDDLAIAVLTADAAGHGSSDQPWGYLARCDMARRLGNAEVMEACLADLKRVAPGSPETREAFARAARQAPVWASAIGISVALAFLVTLVHGLVTFIRSRPRWSAAGAKSVMPLVFALCCLSSAFTSQTARADGRPKQGQDLSRIKIDDANPEASIPTHEEQLKEPLQFGYWLQDLTVRAERARTDNDHVAAARFYRALTKATPTAYSPRRLCEELEAAGDSLNAVVACRTAITREGTNAADFVHFVRLVLAQKDPLPGNEKGEVESQIDHLASELEKESAASAPGQPSTSPTLVPELRCDVAVRFHDVKLLESCTTALAALAPDDPRTVSFQWALAVERADGTAARSFIDRAKELGANQDSLSRMERATTDMHRHWLVRVILVSTLSAFSAAWLAYGLRRLVQRRRAAA